MAEHMTAADLTLEDMRRAHERIRDHIHYTPVLTSSFLNDLTGAELFFKCENFQKAGLSRCVVLQMLFFACATISRPTVWRHILQAIMRSACPMQRAGGAYLAML